MGFEKVEIDQDNCLRIGEELTREKDVVRKLVENDIFVKEVRLSSFSLEDYYLSVTGGAERA